MTLDAIAVGGGVVGAGAEAEGWGCDRSARASADVVHLQAESNRMAPSVLVQGHDLRGLASDGVAAWLMRTQRAGPAILPRGSPPLRVDSNGRAGCTASTPGLTDAAA